MTEDDRFSSKSLGEWKWLDRITINFLSRVKECSWFICIGFRRSSSVVKGRFNCVTEDDQGEFMLRFCQQ